MVKMKMKKKIDIEIIDKKQIPQSEPERQYYFMDIAKNYVEQLSAKKGSPLTFHVTTFGCQMNKHDSERVAGMLEGLGSLPVETIEEADIVVFMTCCVREAADTRLYGQVASMKNIPLRDGTPLDKRYIAVGGCIGQRDGDKLLAALPHLDVVFGTHNLGSLPGLLRRAIEQHGRAAGGAIKALAGL